MTFPENFRDLALPAPRELPNSANLRVSPWENIAVAVSMQSKSDRDGGAKGQLCASPASPQLPRVQACQGRRPATEVCRSRTLRCTQSLANAGIRITRQQGLQLGTQLALACHGGSDLLIRIGRQPLQYRERDGLVVGDPFPEVRIPVDDSKPNFERRLFVPGTIVFGGIVTSTQTSKLLSCEDHRLWPDTAGQRRRRWVNRETVAA